MLPNLKKKLFSYPFRFQRLYEEVSSSTSRRKLSKIAQFSRWSNLFTTTLLFFGCFCVSPTLATPASSDLYPRGGDGSGGGKFSSGSYEMWDRSMVLDELGNFKVELTASDKDIQLRLTAKTRGYTGSRLYKTARMSKADIVDG